jgi:quinol monooxygenase YgiN
MSKKLQLSARMKIREGKLEGFKRQAAICISQVKEKDPGTLQYDWFLNSDKTECEIREAYESSEALLAHVSNLRGPLGILFEQYATDQLLLEPFLVSLHSNKINHQLFQT